MLENILATTSQNVLTLSNLLICMIASLIIGVGIAFIYMYRNTYNKSFVITITLLPVMIQTVIMLVNGNLGTGVAVLGAFSIIRFRSVPGGSREIGSIFFAMALGLAVSMGYVLFAFLFLFIIGSMTILLFYSKFAERKNTEKELKITIPENLDYSGIFEDLFTKYTNNFELIQVKTTNMGSLYELHYYITLKNSINEKNFLDEIRCRNGNLNIVCGRVSTIKEEL